MSSIIDDGVAEFLDGLRSVLQDRSFRPVPVRERMIPKAGGKLRRLGISTVADRVVQASVKLVLEPIFEADFLPCSYGFRPNRRAHDAVAEVRYLQPKCFPHPADRGLTQPAALGHRRARPVGGIVRSLLERGDHHVFDLLDRDRRGPARSRFIDEPIQTRADEPAPPLAHRRLCDPLTLGDLLVGQPVRAAEHDPRP